METTDNVDTMAISMSSPSKKKKGTILSSPKKKYKTRGTTDNVDTMTLIPHLELVTNKADIMSLLVSSRLESTVIFNKYLLNDNQPKLKTLKKRDDKQKMRKIINHTRYKRRTELWEVPLNFILPFDKIRVGEVNPNYIMHLLVFKTCVGRDMKHIATSSNFAKIQKTQTYYLQHKKNDWTELNEIRNNY